MVHLFLLVGDLNSKEITLSIFFTSMKDGTMAFVREIK